MLPWLLALLAGALFAALQYGMVVRREGPATVPPAVLRFAAVALLVALLLDARLGRDQAVRALVALDSSLSWTRGDSTRWPRAVARARELGGDSVVAFGDSVRPIAAIPAPRDLASSLTALAEQAAAEGRATIVITDGESVPPREGLAVLPRGSRVEAYAAAASPDVAVVAVEAPRALASGDTLRVRVTIRSGGGPVAATLTRLAIGGRTADSARLTGLEPFARRTVELEAIVPAGDGPSLLGVVATTDGDVERRNDSLHVGIDVSPAAGAVWVSSAPDLDGRAAIAALRGLGIPTRGFLRVAPGAWRREGSLAAVAEAEVRAAVRDAPLLVVHGDTAIFGDPRALAGDAPLALLPGPAGEPPAGAPPALDEWYPTAAPPSPASAALAGLPWDSLPPVALGPTGPRPIPASAGAWVAVEGRRARRGEPAPLVVGEEAPRRVVVVRATGLARWQARGGAGRDAHQALFGTLFDWLAAARRDARAAVPETRSAREGERIRWRVARTDTAVRVLLVRRGAPARVDTLTLRADAGSIFTTSDPLPAGIYEVRAAGGRSILPINAPDELLPRAATLRSGAVGTSAVASTPPALRDHGAAYGAVVLLLCGEWLLRRRRGLR